VGVSVGAGVSVGVSVPFQSTVSFPFVGDPSPFSGTMAYSPSRPETTP
jgi:hypothetical protein